MGCVRAAGLVCAQQVPRAPLWRGGRRLPRAQAADECPAVQTSPAGATGRAVPARAAADRVEWLARWLVCRAPGAPPPGAGLSGGLRTGCPRRTYAARSGPADRGYRSARLLELCLALHRRRPRALPGGSADHRDEIPRGHARGGRLQAPIPVRGPVFRAPVRVQAPMAPASALPVPVLARAA